MRGALAAAVIIAVLGAGASSASASAPGSLQQLAAPNGCLSMLSRGICGRARLLGEFAAMAMSPDSRFVYGISRGGDAPQPDSAEGITVFRRDVNTGALTQLDGTDGCISSDGDDGQGGLCAVAAGIGGLHGIAVTPDGKNVYVAGGDGIVGFSRNPDTGVLTNDAGCVNVGGTGGCNSSPVAQDGAYLTVSGDGKIVWLIGSAGGSADPNAVATLTRNPDTGILTQVATPDGCISEGGAGGCLVATKFREPQALAASPDGKNAYVAVSEGVSPEVGVVTVMKIEDNGTLTQIDCNGVPTTGCGSPARALADAASIIVSRDGKNVYVGAQGCCSPNTAYGNGTLSVFSRDAGTGRLSDVQCLSDDGGDGNRKKDVCEVARNLAEVSAIAMGRDDGVLYAASSDHQGPSIFARDAGNSGRLSQLAGTDGCLNERGEFGCGHADVPWANSVLVAPGCDFAYFGGHDDWRNWEYAADSSITSYMRAADCTPSSTATLPACSATSPDIVFSVTDRAGDSGAKKLHYKVDGGGEQVAATSAGVTGTITLNFSLPEGKHTVEYWGEDQAFAVEHTHHTADIVIDATKPAVTIKSDQNKTKYYRNQFGSITVTASDAISGLKTDPSVQGEKLNTAKAGTFTITKSATDNCGNSASASFKYSVDKRAVAKPTKKSTKKKTKKKKTKKKRRA